MKCPFCGLQMLKGVLSGDGRSCVRWKEGDEKANLLDSISDCGKVTAAKYTLTSFTVETYYCPICKKMIFDTEISK